MYRVARNGDGFSATKQRHFATKIQPPPGCIYNGVLEDAWYITIAGGRRVAVEAKNYSCASWSGPGIYARAADYADADAGQIDYAGGSTEYRDAHPEPSGNGSRQYGFGVPPQPTYSRGDSTSIYGTPDLPPPEQKSKHKR